MLPLPLLCFIVSLSFTGLVHSSSLQQNETCTVYVSVTTGNDTAANGSQDNPFQTVEAAILYLYYKEPAPLRVVACLEEGTYGPSIILNVDTTKVASLTIRGISNNTILEDYNILPNPTAIPLANFILTIERVILKKQSIGDFNDDPLIWIPSLWMIDVTFESSITPQLYAWDLYAASIHFRNCRASSVQSSTMRLTGDNDFPVTGYVEINDLIWENSETSRHTIEIRYAIVVVISNSIFSNCSVSSPDSLLYVTPFLSIGGVFVLDNVTFSHNHWEGPALIRPPVSGSIELEYCSFICNTNGSQNVYRPTFGSTQSIITENNLYMDPKCPISCDPGLGLKSLVFPCAPCGPGSISNGTLCNNCPVGSYADARAIHCVPCEVGKFSRSNINCTTCPILSGNSVMGSTDCSCFGFGTIIVDDRSHMLCLYIVLGSSSFAVVVIGSITVAIYKRFKKRKSGYHRIN